MKLSTKLTKNHFLAAFFPILLTFSLAFLIIWASPGNTEGLPLLGMVVYLVSFVYFCKRFGMTKEDVIGLTVFFFGIIILGTLVPFSIVMIFFFGWSWLTIMLLVLVGSLIGAAVNGVIYAAIIYVLLSLFIKDKKSPKKSPDKLQPRKNKKKKEEITRK